MSFPCPGSPRLLSAHIMGMNLYLTYALLLAAAAAVVVLHIRSSTTIRSNQAPVSTSKAGL